MTQGWLMGDTFEEALEDVVRALGGWKAAAAVLWPTESPVERARYLRAALDPERREQLSPAALLALMQVGAQRGCLTPLAFLSEACGCRPPEPVTPEDAQAAMAVELREAAAQFAELLTRAEQMQARLVPMARRRED